MRPPTEKGRESCLAVKTSIRGDVRNNGTFVVDAFAAAAKKYSIDGSTASLGGLIPASVASGVAKFPSLLHHELPDCTLP